MIKKILFILLLTFIGLSGYGQTTFTQTFVDRCTGDVKVVTATFVNGRATVAFYNRVKVFTQQEATNGTLQLWLTETYNWWYALSPCSVATQQAQQAQQTAQQAQQAAQTASQAASQAASAASAASSAVSNIPAVPPVNVPPPPPSAPATPPPSTNSSSPPPAQSGGSSSQSSSQSESSSSKSSSSTTETKTESKSETKTETKTEEKKTESKTETKEEKKEESKSETKEEKKEEKKEETKEEKKEEKKKEDDKKKEDKKKEKQQKRASAPPMMVSGDMIGMQSLTGGIDAVLSVGMSKSSIFGDRSYNAGTMIWSNLRQFSLSASTAKIYMSPDYKVSGIESVSVSYSNNFGTNATSMSMSWIEPLSGKKGTVGIGFNGSAVWGDMMDYGTYTIGWNALYTNSFKIGKNITYSPAFIVTNTPINAVNQKQEFNGDAMFILSNGFTIQLTKRFIINCNWTGIKSTNEMLPLINSFIIGSKINL